MSKRAAQAVGPGADKNPRVKLLYVGTEQGHAGVLAKESLHIFSYAPQTLEPPRPERAISLTMPLRAMPWTRMPMLPAFQTFLPEGFLKERIIDKFAKTMKIDDMALLALSGENPIGRLRLSSTPEGGPPSTAREKLSEILAHEGTQDLFEYLCDKYLIASGISGVQPKVMLAVDAPAAEPAWGGQASMPGGREAAGAAVAMPGEATGKPHAETPDGKFSIKEKASLRARQLIVKVAGVDYPDLPVNEYHCMSIARACGADLLAVPDFWLSEDRRRLVIERFDLDTQTGRYLGFEDMVSLQGRVNEEKYQGSYENIAKAVRINCAPAHLSASMRGLFALVVLAVVLRNGDAHLKNFGLLYTDPTTDDVRLAPAYDLVTTTTYLSADKLALKLGGSKAWPTRTELAAFGAKSCALPDADQIIERIIATAMQYRAAESDATWQAQRAVIEAAAGALARAR